jgi:tRNA threonylcarbamoyladenosine biosynthesis protein TsaB
MPHILALDSSTEACSCAISIDGEISESFELIPRGHTRHILPMIQAQMQQAGLEFEQLDAVAVGAGPGSFTGLRIAAGVAQGIAFGADIPLIPVSTLNSMAQQKLAQHNRILACLDARNNEVYWALFDCTDGQLKLLGTERLTKPEALILETDMPCFAVGDGMAFLNSMPAATRALITGLETDIYPRSATIAELAGTLWSQGLTMDPADFSPSYLRNRVTYS